MQQHRQTTNFEEILPNLVLFNLKQLEDFGVLKTPTAKKLINQGKLEAIKIGAKLQIIFGLFSHKKRSHKAPPSLEDYSSSMCAINV